MIWIKRWISEETTLPDWCLLLLLVLKLLNFPSLTWRPQWCRRWQRLHPRGRWVARSERRCSWTRQWQWVCEADQAAGTARWPERPTGQHSLDEHRRKKSERSFDVSVSFCPLRHPSDDWGFCRFSLKHKRRSHRHRLLSCYYFVPERLCRKEQRFAKYFQLFFHRHYLLNKKHPVGRRYACGKGIRNALNHLNNL